MIFLFPRWDMSVFGRVSYIANPFIWKELSWTPSVSLLDGPREFGYLHLAIYGCPWKLVVSKFVYSTIFHLFIGRIQPTCIGVIIHALSNKDFPVRYPFTKQHFTYHFEALVRTGVMLVYVSSIPFPIGSMGLEYLPTWMAQIYGFHAGKHIVEPGELTSPVWRFSLVFDLNSRRSTDTCGSIEAKDEYHIWCSRRATAVKAKSSSHSTADLVRSINALGNMSVIELYLASGPRK